MKKTISVILSICVIITSIFCMAFSAMAKTYIDLTDADKQLNFMVIGENGSTVVLNKVIHLNIDSIVLPEKIIDNDKEYTLIGIDDLAFEDISNLLSITIPKSVENIDTKAFKGCTALTEVIFESGSEIKNIASDAFDGLEKQIKITADNNNHTAIRYCDENGVELDVVAPQTPSTPETTTNAANDITNPSTTTTKPATTKVSTTATTTKSNKITVKKTAVKKLIAGKKNLTVKWKKVSGVTGYQIKIATNSKFTKNKKVVKVKGAKNTSKKIKKLKSKKKYYVKIRAYKVKNNKTYYSKWSKVKTIKVK